jgi:hypothetical protein
MSSHIDQTNSEVCEEACQKSRAMFGLREVQAIGLLHQGWRPFNSTRRLRLLFVSDERGYTFWRA